MPPAPDPDPGPCVPRLDAHGNTPRSGSQYRSLPPGATGQCSETFLAVAARGMVAALLASRRWRPETLRTALHCIGRPTPRRKIWVQTSVAPV